jgi:hypothetical protein
MTPEEHQIAILQEDKDRLLDTIHKMTGTLVLWRSLAIFTWIYLLLVRLLGWRFVWDRIF